MVVGLSLPFGVGDLVRLTGTSDERRASLVGTTGTVVGVRPGDRRVMAIVAFDEGPSETVLVYGMDEAEVVERYRHGVS
ncbi:hypothetical protein [Candidatus Poriferisodalis sp.]|uniref:hypothetical protein n=1 Tax=Candidatus Poriferisodalis sp. TaxID=3101277 RepID=UPI003B012755